MGSAKYIGRVGGLAVALGVGFAVATTPGVALAEPDAGSTSSLIRRVRSRPVRPGRGPHRVRRRPVRPGRGPRRVRRRLRYLGFEVHVGFDVEQYFRVDVNRWGFPAGDDADPDPITATRTGAPEPTTTPTETTALRETTPVSQSGADSLSLARDLQTPKRSSMETTALPGGSPTHRRPRKVTHHHHHQPHRRPSPSSLTRQSTTDRSGAPRNNPRR